jgi:GNAT superfamily N-acetyltransferase
MCSRLLRHPLRRFPALPDQVLGAEAGRAAVIYDGESLKEGHVEAFGADPQLRRRGIGTALQQHAAQQCRIVGCYQNILICMLCL